MSRPFLFRVCPVHAQHADVDLARTWKQAEKLARRMLVRMDELVGIYDIESGKLLATFI